MNRIHSGEHVLTILFVHDGAGRLRFIRKIVTRFYDQIKASGSSKWDIRIPKRSIMTEEVIMNRQSIIIALVFGFMLASFSFSGESKSNQDRSFKTVHLFNLKSELKQRELEVMIKDLNKCLAKHGFSEVKYKAWKLRSESNCKYTYLFESTWPDVTTYNKIHETIEYKRIRTKWQQNWASVLDEVYGRYEPLN